MKRTNPLSEMESILTALNLRMGLTPQQAQDSAREAMKIMCGMFSGERLYFPSGRDDQDRNERIYAAVIFGGIPLREVATRSGMSKSNVARIVSDMRRQFAGENNA